MDGVWFLIFIIYLENYMFFGGPPKATNVMMPDLSQMDHAWFLASIWKNYMIFGDP
jgi:hypothetical protein